MKRLGLFLLAVLMVAGMAGCGGEDGNDDDGWMSVIPVGSNDVPPPPESGPPESKEVTIAKCLSSKGAVLYGAAWCPYTQKQIESFEGGFQYLKYVECTKKATLCQQKSISGYPTWIIGGSRILGYQAPTEIGSAAGCSW